jgi:hypothetical protein
MSVPVSRSNPATEPGEPADGLTSGVAHPQQDVVPVTGQLLDALPGPGQHRHPGDARQLPGHRGEPGRIEQQLGFPVDAVGHEPGEIGDWPRRFGAARARNMQRGQQRQAAHARHHNGPARADHVHRTGDDALQVDRPWSVLCQRIDQHQIERPGLELAEVVRCAAGQLYRAVPACHPVFGLPDVGEGALRQVGGPVGGALRGQAQQQPAVAAADLQNRPRPHREGSPHDRIGPLTQLRGGQRRRRRRAVPAGQVQPGVFVGVAARIVLGEQGPRVRPSGWSRLQ